VKPSSGFVLPLQTFQVAPSLRFTEHEEKNHQQNIKSTSPSHIRMRKNHFLLEGADDFQREKTNLLKAKKLKLKHHGRREAQQTRLFPLLSFLWKITAAERKKADYHSYFFIH